MPQVHVTLHAHGSAPKIVTVATLVDAMYLITEWQDGRGLGASDCGSKHGLVTGAIEGRLTYNGKFLPKGGV